MTIEDFRTELNKILYPKTSEERRRLSEQHTISSPGNAAWVISGEEEAIKNLIVKFIHDGLPETNSKDSLLKKLERINQLCLENISTQGYINYEFTGWASTVLTDLANHCDNFEELQLILKGCNERIIRGMSRASIDIDSLIDLKLLPDVIGMDDVWTNLKGDMDSDCRDCD